MSTTAITKHEGASALAQTKDRLNVFRAFVKDVLKDGIDYGCIPGTQKPTLLKSGAERIAQLYDLTATFEEVKVAEEWDADVAPFFFYRLRCRLTHRASGEVVGEGFGSANSRESKHRYRWEYWPDKKNEPPSDQGWEPFSGKYGRTFRRRSENPDTADIANTVLKIAKKRAFVDAVLTVSAASEFFGQDIEDLPIDREALEDAAPQSEDEVASIVDDMKARIDEADSVPALQAVAQLVERQSKAVKSAVRKHYGVRLRALRTGKQREEAAT